MSGGGTALLGEAVPSDTAILDLFIGIVNGEWRVRRLSPNGRGWEGYETMTRGPAIARRGGRKVGGGFPMMRILSTSQGVNQSSRSTATQTNFTPQTGGLVCLATVWA